MPDPILEVRDLSITAGGRPVLKNIDLDLLPREVLGLVGPSGAGKSTLLRALNRLLELQSGYRVRGTIRLHGTDIHRRGVDADRLRERLGMIFQQPAVFPTTIAKNVLFGAARLRRLNRSARAELVERALRDAALWHEVRDRLRDSALRLSIGQQQRLCLARALALDPEILLMDEPTSALDPKATEAIEERILALRQTRSVILVTHDLEQARRITDRVACLCADEGHGELLESACCDAALHRAPCRAAIDELDPATADPQPPRPLGRQAPARER